MNLCHNARLLTKILQFVVERWGIVTSVTVTSVEKLSNRSDTKWNFSYTCHIICGASDQLEGQGMAHQHYLG